MKDAYTPQQRGRSRWQRFKCASRNLARRTVKVSRGGDSHFCRSRACITRKGLLCLALIIGSFASSALPQTAPPDRPNIVVILADDLGYGDVSFNGCPDYQTPNIDSLATTGVWCSNGYVTHPFCSPSRAGLITGRYQQRFGHENNAEDDTTNPGLGLPMQELLLPQILKPAGYVCGIVGKWHLGEAPNLRPTQRGFDEFFGFLSCCSNYFN